MGFYPYAHLAFGIDLREDSPLVVHRDGTLLEDSHDPDQEAMGPLDLEEWLASKAGLADPYDDLPDAIMRTHDQAAFAEWKTANPEWVQDRDDYADRKKRLVAACPVDLIDYGSDEFSQFVVAIPGTHLTASWDSAEAKDLPGLMAGVDVQKIADARVFCDENDWPDFDNPEWLMFASYG